MTSHDPALSHRSLMKSTFRQSSKPVPVGPSRNAFAMDLRKVFTEREIETRFGLVARAWKEKFEMLRADGDTELAPALAPAPRLARQVQHSTRKNGWSLFLSSPPTPPFFLLLLLLSLSLSLSVSLTCTHAPVASTQPCAAHTQAEVTERAAGKLVRSTSVHAHTHTHAHKQHICVPTAVHRDYERG